MTISIPDWLLPWKARKMASRIAALEQENASLRDKVKSIEPSLAANRRAIGGLLVWVRKSHRLDSPMNGIREVINKSQ